ncbi:MAG: cadherin repeat domain-containing protein [Fibrobacter sp.]|nr:cadherin repeat domain-containing protein [Fibrobacter sp.]
MLVGKNLIKKLVGSLATVLAFAVPSLAADVRPLHFEGISTDPKVQQDFWDSLMQFKMYGAEGIEFVEGGNIHITDTLGRFGTSRGDFVIIGDNNEVGGPILVGGDIQINGGGKDVFMTGPTRVSKSIIVKNNQLNSVGQNFFHGPTCVSGSVSSAFSDGVAPQNQFFGANYASCPDSVPNFMDGLKVPSSPDAVPAGKPVLSDINESNKVFNIDIPAETPGDSGLYDIYINNITLTNQGALAIRMPEGGRLTRIFVNSLSIGSQSTIQVYYKNKTGENGGYTAVENEKYAGDLLFYVNSDLNLTARDNGKTIQGTFISSGTISVKQQLTLAGQLLAKKLLIAANFDGSSFFFKSFDSQTFKVPETSVLDTLYESKIWDNVEQRIDVRLTGAPSNPVTFHYCFVFPGKADADMSTGNFEASEEDIYTSNVPLCNRGGTPGSARFLAGRDTLENPITLKIKDDILLENEEYFYIRIFDVAGARVSKDSLVTSMDFKLLIVDDDKTPVCHDTTITMLEDDTVFLAGEGFNYIAAYAHDGETPLDMYYQVPILETPAYKLYIGEEAVKPEAELYRPIPNYILTSTRYTPGKNENNSTVTGSHFDSLTFAIEVNAANGRKGTYSDPCKLYIDVMPVNDKPVLNDTTITIRENTPVDSVLLQLVATDVENDKLTYAIDSGDVALFTLKGAVKDSLVLKGALDYETQKVHVLKVVVTDDGEGNLKDTAYVTIKLIDENETPKFDKSSYEFTVREHAPYDSIFGTIHATDPDANSEQASFKELSYTYKLITPTKDNSAFKLFEKEGNFAVLNSDSLNYESFDKYELWAYATDAEDLKDSAKVIINVTDINEEPAFEKEPLYYQANFVEVPEITTNHDLLTFNFSDPDIKSLWATNGFHKLNLELLECTLDACQLGNEKEIDTDVNTLFAIKMNSDSTSGVLSLKGASSLDYEKDSTYNMMVRVYDNKGSAPSYADTIVIRVRITNVNEKPKFDSTKYTFSVKEHQVDIVELGKVHASDPDSNTTLKYSFANGALTDASGKFSIDASTGLIATTESLDYETQDSYSMKVYVTDNDVDNPLQDSVPVTINVIDINETPWADAITCKIKETAAKNTAPNLNGSTTEKCVVKGQDPDIKNINFNQLTYTWADATEKGADIFAINATTGAVTLVKENVLDYDAGDRSYTLTVKIADNGGLDSTTTVLINIENVNEPPFLDDVTISIPENTETAVAIYTLVATDPEPGALDFEITSITPEEDFEVVPLGNKKGVLVVVDDLDHETKPTYTLKVKVTDAGDLSYVATVTIIVTDVNEPPYFKKKVNTFHVKEHNDADAYVGQVYGYDDDKDERYNQLTYSLVSDPSGLFAVSKDGVITVPEENVLNFESLAEDFMYQLKVKVSDGYLDATTTVYVIVDDVNEKPELKDTTFSVKEHASSGTVVGTVVATDKDKGQRLSYQLLTTSAEFTVSNEGKITTRKNLNFETKQQYTIDVLVTDDGENLPNDSNLTDTATITINIIDINEKPVVGDQSFTILETAEYPDIVGTFKNATDKDTLNDYFKDLSFFISDTIVDGVETNAAQYFTINESTGEISVKQGATFDYETKSKVYYLKLKVRDHEDPDYDDPALEAYALITINIENVPEPPTFEPKFRDYDVDENSPKGTVVGELAASDNDEDETLVYTLKNPDGSESKEFQVFYDDDKATIKVRENANLDYETNAEYKVIVIVTDKTNLEDTAYVTITINDVNEKPTMEEQYFELFENSGANYKLDGTIQSGDLDTASAFTKNFYEGVGGDTALFKVNSRGEIFANYDMDYEEYKAKNKTTFVVKVKVQDKVVDTLFVVENIYINLKNVNENPEVLTDTLYASEDALAGTEIGLLDADDPDGPTTFTYTLIRASKQFNVDPDGIVTVKTDNILDYETKDHAYTIYVNVQDADGGVSDTKPVVIIVSDVNEPPVLNDTILYVREDASVDTIFAKIFGHDPDIYTEAFNQLSYEMLSPKDTFDILPDGSVKLLRRLDYEADSLYERVVRVTDGTFFDTANVIIKVVDVIESTVVEIVKVEDPDSLWEYPDTVYTNIPEKNVTWLREDKVFSFDTTLREGPNVIKRCYLNHTKNYAGCDSVIIYYSNATPVVKIYSDPADISADNVYTIVEDVDKSDTNYYVNTTDKKITVSVTDTAAGVKKKFDINLELDTVGVPEKTLKTVNEITKEKVTLRDGSDVEVVKTPVNGEKVVVSYQDTVEINGKPVLLTVSYDTDTKGNETKVAVINEKGKVDSIQVITVSYTTKVNGKEMVISYKADAITGEVLNTTAGGQLTKADNNNDVATAQDAVGTFSVSYNYVEKGNSVTVHYVVDEDGDMVTNEDGDIGYSVSYSYTNKFGNTATKSLYIVLDRVGPKVEILDPVKGSKTEVVTSNFINVKWTVNGEVQDTLTTQGLEKGLNAIVRFYRDKAGNEASDTVFIYMKNGKNIEIAIEQPVTEITREKVEEYYAKNEPVEGQTFAVSVMNPTTGEEVETQKGGKDLSKKESKGSGDAPYPGLEGHLGPTLALDIKLPVVRQTNENAQMDGLSTGTISGLATFDDIVNAEGLVSLDGVDANNGEKLTVDEYVKEYCVDGFNPGSDLSKVNLYDSKASVKIWVYTTTGEFVNYYSFSQKLNDPNYTNEAGMLRLFFEMKPDENGDVRNDAGRLIGTGSYIYKVEVKLRSELKCSLPPVMDASSPKKGDIIRNDEDLLKSFGYKRPAQK